MQSQSLFARVQPSAVELSNSLLIPSAADNDIALSSERRNKLISRWRYFRVSIKTRVDIMQVMQREVQELKQYDSVEVVPVLKKIARQLNAITYRTRWTVQRRDTHDFDEMAEDFDQLALFGLYCFTNGTVVLLISHASWDTTIDIILFILISMIAVTECIYFSMRPLMQIISGEENLAIVLAKCIVPGIFGTILSEAMISLDDNTIQNLAVNLISGILLYLAMLHLSATSTCIGQEVREIAAAESSEEPVNAEIEAVVAETLIPRILTEWHRGDNPAAVAEFCKDLLAAWIQRFEQLRVEQRVEIVVEEPPLALAPVFRL